ncbi:tetratricopeptide repeat protein [Patescibacteria group bacterium]|nr:tetratricopeptide repeat protein [Patescibacteria group bacterium]MBU1703542.1 tetratricopeptide repeat protein [Patescibacteria group bacterium]MBU1953882.1 tetratricopeptide repeat protein [Patescibacteria group bacterium]
MNKTLSFLIYIVLLIIVGLGLYAFEVWPFNSGGPLIPKTEPVQTQITEKLPDFLAEEGVAREKTYDEHISRGKLLAQNGYNGLAINEFEAAAKMAPQKTEPLMETGKIQLETNDLIKAKLNFQAVLKLEPDNLQAKIYLSNALIADRKIDEAKAVLDSIKVHNQTSKYLLGIVTAYTGDHEKAEIFLREAMTIGADTNIAANAQNFLSAYSEFDSNQGGTNIHLLTLLARSYDQTKEYQMAIPMLFKVIKEKKDYRDAWILLGYAYLSTQKYQDAAQSLEEARKLDPEKPQTLFFLGLSYFALGDLQKAADSLELAKQNGYEPKVQLEQKLAEIYLQLKNYEKSAASYENVLALNNKDINYYIKPIWIYLDRLNEPEKAVKLAAAALAAHPAEAMGFNLVGWAQIGAGNFTRAREYLEKARAIDPNLDAIYLNYGKLYEKLGDIQGAISLYKKAYQMGRGNGISSAAADLYNKLIGKADNKDYSTIKANLLYQ